MAKTIDELKAQANQIKNETAQGANTSQRIGLMNLDIVEKIEEERSNIDTKFTELEESTNTKFSELEESTNTKFSELAKNPNAISNFIDKNSSYNKDTGDFAYSDFYDSALVLCNGNTSYLIYGVVYDVVVFFNAEKRYLSSHVKKNGAENELIFTTPSDCQYLGISFRRGQDYTNAFISNTSIFSYLQNKLIDNVKSTPIILNPYIQIGKAYNITTGALTKSPEYNCCLLKLHPNTTYIINKKPYLIIYFGKYNESGDVISHTSDTYIFTTPIDCNYVALDFRADETDFNKVCINTVSDIIEKPIRISDYIDVSTAYNITNGTKSPSEYYDSCIMPVKEGQLYKIYARVPMYDGREIILVFFDKDMKFISGLAAKINETINIPSNVSYLAIDFDKLLNIYYPNCYFYIQKKIPNSYYLHHPCFTEYDRTDVPNNKAKVAVGMLGSKEANLSMNMDYYSGIHKYYDKTKPAMWLAISGANCALQYTPPNLDDAGTNDVWELGGYQYTWWSDSIGRFIVGTSLNEEKGNACFSGNRQKVGDITFAGLNDCVIEGNRKRGEKGAVYINCYNDGIVSIAQGGGKVGIRQLPNEEIDIDIQMLGKLGVDTIILTNAPKPESSTSPGYKGEFRFDTDYVYICVDANKWKRIPLNNDSW